MGESIIKSGGTDLIRALDEQGVSELMKPLIREIHLFDTYLSGTSLPRHAEGVSSLTVGDALQMQREENKFDDFTILVKTTAGIPVGYIPEQDSPVFARLLDAGKALCAKVADVERGGVIPRVRVGIYLVDY